MSEKVIGHDTASFKPGALFTEWLAFTLRAMAEAGADSVEQDVQSWCDGQPVAVTIEVRIKRGTHPHVG